MVSYVYLSFHIFRYYQENQNNNSSTKAVIPEKTPPKTAIIPKEQTFVFDHNKTKTEGEFLVTKSSRPSSASRQKDSTKQGRPPSGKGNPGRVMAPVNATSISAYIQMKKSGYQSNQGVGGKEDGLARYHLRSDHLEVYCLWKLVGQNLLMI